MELDTTTPTSRLDITGASATLTCSRDGAEYPKNAVREYRLEFQGAAEGLRTLLAETSRIVWTADPNGMMKDASSWNAFTGQSVEESSGLGWLDSVHPDERLLATQAWLDALTVRSRFSIELRLRRHDGIYWRCAVHAVPLLGQNGSVSEWMGACASIDNLEDVERQNEEFLIRVSHDIKNPLTAIAGTAQLLMRQFASVRSPDIDRVRAGLEAITQAAAQIARQLSEVTDLTYLRMGRPLDLNVAPTDLVALAAQVVQVQRQSTNGHVLSLRSPCEVLVAVCDASRIQRVLHNLVARALIHSPEDGAITLIVSEKSDSAGAWAAIQVHDQGIGAPEEYSTLQGERIYRSSTVAGQIAGTAIGWAGIQQIVGQHGGTVAVASERADGTTVTICLPLSVPQVEADEPVQR